MVKTYNPKEVVCTLGSHILSGYADDSFITIEPSGDGTTKKVGCDGEVARAVSPDKSYKIKISLLQTSDSNTFLQQNFDHDQETGDGLFPLTIKDLKGGMLFNTESAWVIKNAAHTFGKETNNRDWEIDTGEATFEAGSGYIANTYGNGV